METRRSARQTEREKKVKKQKLILAAAALLLIAIAAWLLLHGKAGDQSTAEASGSSAAEADADAAYQNAETAEVDSSAELSDPALQETSEETETADPGAAADGVLPVPEAEDGSGSAGLMPLDERMSSLSAEPGLVSDGQNAWYTPDLVNCYYNGWFTSPEGLTYHFDTSGLADYGWKLIGGQGCYFDENAVYRPEQDPNKLLAFTFDDGPSPGMGGILDLCEETGARVTFFMIGKQVENGGAVLPLIVQARCEVGNHSYTHTQQIKLTPEESAAEYATTDDLLASFSGGITADVYRFPYGDYTTEHQAAVGKPCIMWSVDSLDWDLQETQPIIDRVLSQITEGDIILMHDRYDATVEACQYMFPYLISQGYQLVTVKELAAAKGYELEPNKSYYGFCQEYIEQGRVWQ